MSKMTYEDILELVRSGAQVLSDSADALGVDVENRSLMCCIKVQAKVAVLVVSASHVLEPHVLSYQETLRRRGYTFSRIQCSMQEIQELYRVSRRDLDAEAGNETEWQSRVVRLIEKGAGLRASDVHITVRRDHCDVRCRINGELVLLEQLRPADGLRVCATIYQSMCDVAEPTFKPHQAQRARMKEEFLSECGLNGARVNTRPLVRGMLMVIRLLYADSGRSSKSLGDLGYFPEQQAMLKSMTRLRSGIVLFSGATGSGKSTTLKVVLEESIKARPTDHILTLEDPPEYEIGGANQSPVMGDRGDAKDEEHVWAMAISDAMRLDPDVIMIGEVRDAITAKMAIRAAMTGHFVWTTIHANDALATLSRLEDEGTPKTLLTDHKLIVGLVNQSLVQVLCDQCKIPLIGNEHCLDAETLERVRRFCVERGVFLQGPGCGGCDHTGVAGRTVVAEIIRTSAGLMQAFGSGHHYQALQYWLEQMDGMSKMRSLIRKIDAGHVDPRAGERVLGPLADDC
ncbi:type ii secretion system protein [Pandoraea faecigallinarum]|uniref:Type ii secretion system protein n=1 Tax=Pandoraea faecigallinarum TaxID=656179 RepID=A0A0H3X1Z5_9BURK|nr:ATPase, T2SS/T4P/T4SS family [Pandoraea faecigallinarum]AKM32906.2 type ii secretion system protein [Pandoraea faecigallinarum]